MRPALLLAGAVFAGSGLLAAGCIDRGLFACELPEQCGDAGVCETSGYCSYPDPECASGRRYSEVSEFGAVCTETEAASGGGTTVGTDPQPVPGDSCGDSTLDADEVCDDGNRRNGDGCNSYCIDPGGTVWEQFYDSETHDEDRAFAIAMSPSGDTFAITGVTAVPDEGWDILVQLYRADTGELLWTQSRGGGAKQDDTGEEIAFDSQGNLTVAGQMVGSSTGEDVWLAKFDAAGNELWSTLHDEAGGDDRAQSLDVGADDAIVLAGHVDVLDGEDLQSDIWLARYDANGVPSGAPLRVAGAGAGNDTAIDVRTDATGRVYATGQIWETSEVASVWTAAYDANDQLSWSDVYTASDPASVDRGVGLGFDLDANVIVAGTAGNDIWVRRYDEAGTVTETIVVEGPEGMHDEASDAVFAEDGSFVVTGFTGFATQGFARSDIWVRRYDAQSSELWTVRLDGDAKEIDKALAVVGLDDGAVIAAGYVTTPGQLRDVWLRKIAP